MSIFFDTEFKIDLTFERTDRYFCALPGTEQDLSIGDPDGLLGRPFSFLRRKSRSNLCPDPVTQSNSIVLTDVYSKSNLHHQGLAPPLWPSGLPRQSGPLKPLQRLPTTCRCYRISILTLKYITENPKNTCSLSLAHLKIAQSSPAGVVFTCRTRMDAWIGKTVTPFFDPVYILFDWKIHT